MTRDPEVIVPAWPVAGHVRAFTTTRRGGVSEGPWQSWNLGTGSGDDPAAVKANRRRLAAMTPTAPCWLDQVHGRSVIGLSDWHAGVRADAAWTGRPGTVAAILTADCLPVLLADRAGTVVAAVHAGWRGLAAGVLGATVAALPVPADELAAWIGPGIGPAAYQVGPEVRAPLVEQDASLSGFFRPDGPGHYRADLKGLAARLLDQAGVGQVVDSGLCTHADADRFYSHRRDGRTGRMATVVWLESLYDNRPA